MNPVPVIPYGQQRGLSPVARRRWIAAAVGLVLVLVVVAGLAVYQRQRAIAAERDAVAAAQRAEAQLAAAREAANP